MQFEEIKSLIELEVPNALCGEDVVSTPKTLLIDREAIFSVCQLLYSHKNTYFDSLSCLTGLDNGTEAGSLEVVYHLYSIPYHLHVALKVFLKYASPTIDSVTSIWKTANWHEREIYDLLGIKFINHPDLRRILLPNDWKGHPLRKEYKEEENYHEIKIKY